ncbi:MAG TPA: SPOR domain-containing protein [Saprospiraceae bacterium]|nr:SPOR domain-containing protein [Saprospiraceae bacterium]HMP24761.1 SPOR domain-containing protein [Saprospiraceae bacterium]
MQIDVGASIAALLYDNQTVSIPGLGSFISSYKPANTDPVEGKIHPPARQLNFNKNLLLDDGLLVQYLRKHYNVTYPTAMLAVEQYVEQAKATIERRDILTIPGVGRLYKDYEQNFQFLPDDVNFNTDAYGLPTVQFYPVLRQQREPATPGKTTTTPRVASTAKPDAPPSGLKKWLQQNMALVSSVLVIVVAVGIYWQFFRPAQALPQAEELPQSRYNVSPSRMTSDDELLETAPGSIADEDNINDDDADEQSTEGPTLRTQQPYALIGLGMFGNTENVDRLVKQVFEAGYEPYTEKSGKLTRVGVQIPYNSEKEIQDALKDIQEKLSIKAVVLKRTRN